MINATETPKTQTPIFAIDILNSLIDKNLRGNNRELYVGNSKLRKAINYCIFRPMSEITAEVMPEFSYIEENEIQPELLLA